MGFILKKKVEDKVSISVLGFTVDFQYGDLVGMKYGEVLVHLSGPGLVGNQRAAGEGHLYIFCDEVDAYFQDIRSKGARVIVEPADREYGMRDFAIQDPDGNIPAFGKGINP